MNRYHKNRFAALLEPPERMKCSEWADKFAYIPGDGNSEPGKYHLSRMPHQAAMLDDPMEPGVRETFHLGASQAMAKTCCGNIRCKYGIAVFKRSIIMVRPTKDFAMEWMRGKFLPSVDATPAMAGLLVEPRKRDSRSTALNRRFPGGSIRVIGAKSPSAFRGTSAPHIEQDEIDAYDASKEGDPVALADRAAITFSNAWLVKYSTPTIKGFSRIEAGFLSGDQQYYFVPCPVCGGFQHLKFSQLKFSFTEEEHKRFAPECDVKAHTWTLADPDHPFPIVDTRRALYVCEHCAHGWTDVDRIAAYMSGHPDNPPVIVGGKELRAEWRATAPFNGIRSRHLSGMYLTIGRKEGFENYLHQFAEQFLAAKRGGRESLMTWTNMFLAEAFEDWGEKLEWKTIADRAEDYGPELPVEVVIVGAGIDVHPDRVEISTYGWGDQEEIWALEHKVITGDFDMPSTQELVEAYLFGRRFHHPILGELEIVWKCIDCGHQTKVKAVYHFCRKHKEQRCYAVKGFSESLGSLYSIADVRGFGIKRYNLNADAIKDTIASRLRNTEPGARYIHFPKEVVGPTKEKTAYTVKFYNQLCSEKRVFLNGKWSWKKLASNTRNEALDTLVYCMAGWEIIQCASFIVKKWQEVCGILKERAPKPEPAAKKEYVLNQPKEVKLPELRQAQPVRNPAPVSSGWSKGFRGKWR